MGGQLDFFFLCVGGVKKISATPLPALSRAECGETVTECRFSSRKQKATAVCVFTAKLLRNSDLGGGGRRGHRSDRPIKTRRFLSRSVWKMKGPGAAFEVGLRKNLKVTAAG